MVGLIKLPLAALSEGGFMPRPSFLKTTCCYSAAVYLKGIEQVENTGHTVNEEGGRKIK